jgi:hypothetical protein
MIERRSARPPVTYTTFQARDLGKDTASLFQDAARDAVERFKPEALLVGASWRVLGARKTAATPSPSAPVEAPLAVRLSIDALPRGAHVSVDDAPVMLPFTLRADRLHRVRVDAPGYQPWGALVQPSHQDVALRFAGAALPDASPPAVTPTAIPMVRRPDPPRASPRRAPRGGASHGQGGLIADPGF